MRCPNLCALTFAALMLGPGAFPSPAQSAPGKTPPSWKLLAESERAMNTIGESARKSPVGQRAGSPQYAPFWDAMEEMDRALAEVESSMAHRNQQFFQALRSGSRALAQLRVVWPRTGVQDPAVALGLESLGSSYRQLRTRFGPEQGRYQQGGGLSEQEKHNFRQIQQAQLRFIALLQPLRFQAEKRGDRAMVAHLDRILDQAEDIVDANPTLDEYLEASMAEDEIIGEWDGNAPYAEAAYKTAWHQADAAVEELYVSAEAGFVFSVNLGDPEPGATQPGQKGGQEGETQAQIGTPAPGITIFQPIGETAAPEEAEPAPEPAAPENENGVPEVTAPEAAMTEAATPEAAPEVPEAAHEVIEEGAPEESFDITEEDLPVAAPSAEKAEAAPDAANAGTEEKLAEKPVEKAAETRPAPSSTKKTQAAKTPAKPPASKTSKTKKPKKGQKPLASVPPH